MRTKEQICKDFQYAQFLRNQKLFDRENPIHSETCCFMDFERMPDEDYKARIEQILDQLAESHPEKLINLYFVDGAYLKDNELGEKFKLTGFVQK